MARISTSRAEAVSRSRNSFVVHLVLRKRCRRACRVALVLRGLMAVIFAAIVWGGAANRLVGHKAT
ncbi:hypothetical protein [Streptomyces sp. NPDC056661]|uniref:hypothetical protein n=1 Tax=Streptomyces sp. NPDC056661 TaxID=3345898 RepID=UPI0036B1B1AA